MDVENLKMDEILIFFYSWIKKEIPGPEKFVNTTCSTPHVLIQFVENL